jgi:hypothetical protein
MNCTCGIPSKANVFIEVIYGRGDGVTGTETDYSHTFWCDEHAPTEGFVRQALEEGRDAIVVPDGFEILEWKEVVLR